MELEQLWLKCSKVIDRKKIIFKVCKYVNCNLYILIYSSRDHNRCVHTSDAAPGYSPKTTWIVWGVASIWIPFGRMLQGVSTNMKLFVTVFGVFVWTQVAILLYSDPIWKRITAPLLILCAMYFADALLILVFYLVDSVYLDDVTGINIRSTILAASA